jgi:uncharacterized repeat protein (TIGR01451 family)
MAPPRNLTPNKQLRLPRALVWVVVGLFALGVLAVMPGAWALPAQAPDFQTVPTLTPTPTRPGAGATTTATPDATDTPPPIATATDTPPPIATATNAPPPGATATNTPLPDATATSTPTRTRTAPLPAPPSQPGAGTCWTVPTPGFVPERVLVLTGSIESNQFLVVPGQTITQRLLVKNTSTSGLPNVLICNPLNPALIAGQPNTTQGIASIEPKGLLVELGFLAASQTAQVELSLRIPADYPLGGVIESQAWLFAEGQRASTDLLTWALPPAYLPPTGQ